MSQLLQAIHPLVRRKNRFHLPPIGPDVALVSQARSYKVCNIKKAKRPRSTTVSSLQCFTTKRNGESLPLSPSSSLLLLSSLFSLLASLSMMPPVLTPHSQLSRSMASLPPSMTCVAQALCNQDASSKMVLARSGRSSESLSPQLVLHEPTVAVDAKNVLQSLS